MINARPLAMPTIHLNGSSPNRLLEELMEAHHALAVARDMLAGAAPNARDYYPQGDDAFRRARTEHNARIAALVEVIGEIAEIAEAIDAQAGARRR